MPEAYLNGARDGIHGFMSVPEKARILDVVAIRGKTGLSTTLDPLPKASVCRWERSRIGSRAGGCPEGTGPSADLKLIEKASRSISSGRTRDDRLIH